MASSAISQNSVAVFKPGDKIRQKGIYRVFHHAHRTPHESSVIVLDVFPECNQCGDRVRFQLLRKSGELLRDYNFARPRKREEENGHTVAAPPPPLAT